MSLTFKARAIPQGSRGSIILVRWLVRVSDGRMFVTDVQPYIEHPMPALGTDWHDATQEFAHVNSDYFAGSPNYTFGPSHDFW